MVGPTDLSRYFGKSLTSINNWVGAGPFETIRDKKTGKYDRDEFVRALVNWQASRLAGRDPVRKGGLDLNSEKAKLAQAQTEEKLLKNAQAKSELIPTTAVKQLLERAVSISRERILSKIGVLAPLMQSADHPVHECEEILRDHLYEAMNDLAAVTAADFRDIGSDTGDSGGDAGVEGSVATDIDRVVRPVPARRGKNKRNAGKVAD